MWRKNFTMSVPFSARMRSKSLICEDRGPALRVEHVLQLGQPRDVLSELGAGGRLVGVLASVGGVDATQRDASAGPDAVGGHGGALSPPAVGVGNRASARSVMAT